MPAFRHGGALHYYAHVPKCGGKSVEAYLRARFGPLALLDDHHEAVPRRDRWSKTSPQHIARRHLDRIVPPDWFASAFAVVRHPVTRFASAYNYQVAVLGTIPPGMGAERWLDEYLALSPRAHLLFDNHLCAQDDLVPAAAAAFRLEEGLDAVVAHLDAVTGDRGGPRRIEHLHGTRDRLEGDAPATEMPAALARRLEDLYRRDMDRFGYAPQSAPVALHVPTARTYAGRGTPRLGVRLALPLSRDRWRGSRRLKRTIMQLTGIDLS